MRQPASPKPMLTFINHEMESRYKRLRQKCDVLRIVLSEEANNNCQHWFALYSRDFGDGTQPIIITQYDKYQLLFPERKSYHQPTNMDPHWLVIKIDTKHRWCCYSQWTKFQILWRSLFSNMTQNEAHSYFLDTGDVCVYRFECSSHVTFSELNVEIIRIL